MKKNKWLTAIVVFFAILFTACEEDVSNSYFLSEDLKEIGDFGKGSTWTYNVTFKDTVWFSYKSLYRDTFVVGDTIRFTDYKVLVNDITTGDTFYAELKDVVENDDSYVKVQDTVVNIFGDTTYLDIMQKVDTFRVVGKYVENIYGYNVPNIAFSLEENVDMSYTYPYGQGVTFTEDTTFYLLFDINKMTGLERQYYRDKNYFVQEVDTFYVRLPYTIRKAMGPQEVRDVIELTEVASSSFDYEMRTISSSNEYLKKTFTSSLWPKAEFYDLYYAASGGNEFYKRQVKSPSVTQDLVTFNYTEGDLDTNFEAGSVGTYSIEEVDTTMTIANVSFDKVWVVKSNVNNMIDGTLVIKDMEYWVVEGKGIVKIIDNTANAEWELLNATYED